MTTVAICVNKNNLNGLKKVIAYSCGEITALREYPTSWHITAVSDNIKSEFVFDKRDFSSAAESMNAIIRSIQQEN